MYLSAVACGLETPAAISYSEKVELGSCKMGLFPTKAVQPFESVLKLPCIHFAIM